GSVTLRRSRLRLLEAPLAAAILTDLIHDVRAETLRFGVRRPTWRLMKEMVARMCRARPARGSGQFLVARRRISRRDSGRIPRVHFQSQIDRRFVTESGGGLLRDPWKNQSFSVTEFQSRRALRDHLVRHARMESPRGQNQRRAIVRGHRRSWTVSRRQCTSRDGSRNAARPGARPPMALASAPRWSRACALLVTVVRD